MSRPQISIAENTNFAVEAKGTVIKVAIVDNDIVDVVASGFDRLVVERSTDGGILWPEVTSASDRPALTADQTSYVWRDTAGADTYLYRIRYLNTSNSDLTEASASIAGAGLAIRNILTVPELKQRYLFGLDLTDDAGNEFPEAAYQHYILTAIRWLEHELDISILPTTCVEKHDYYVRDYNAFSMLQLDLYPVISVEAFRVQYPSGQNVVVWPEEWWRINHAEGHIQIVPTAGTLSELLVGQGGSFLPAIYGGLGYLPQLFEIAYTAGFEEGRIPRNLIDVIGMFASMGPFNIFGDLIAGAGIANTSLSIDGLSQTIGTTSSATNAGYGARITQYSKQIKTQIPTLRSYYKRVARMVVA